MCIRDRFTNVAQISQVSVHKVFTSVHNVSTKRSQGAHKLCTNHTQVFTKCSQVFTECPQSVHRVFTNCAQVVVIKGWSLGWSYTLSIEAETNEVNLDPLWPALFPHWPARQSSAIIVSHKPPLLHPRVQGACDDLAGTGPSVVSSKGSESGPRWCPVRVKPRSPSRRCPQRPLNPDRPMRATTQILRPLALKWDHMQPTMSSTP